MAMLEALGDFLGIALSSTLISCYRADFLAGQYFDIRLEVHQPVNGSEAIGLPLDERFTFTVAKKGAATKPVTEYFKVQEPKLEKWNFTWYEGKSNSHASVVT
jgi:hypothetical protein